MPADFSGDSCSRVQRDREAALTAFAWNGTVGGVLVFDVADTLTSQARP